MIVKKHIAGEGRIVFAICDDELKGKKFTQGRLQLDLSGSFYAGVPSDPNDLIKDLGNCTVNIVGKKSIAVLEKAGILSSKNAITIDGIPHLQLIIN